MFRSLALLLTALTLASQPLAAAPDPPPTAQVSIYCFRYAPGLDTIHLRANPTDYLKTELSTANIVGPQQVLVDSGSFTLHRREAAADGTITWPLAGRVRLPEACPHALVLLVPAPAGDALPYRGLAFPHNDRDFPLGSMKLVNLSPYAVRGAVGDDKVAIASGKTETFKPTGEPGVPQSVLFQYQRDERWQRMAVTRWTLRDDRRLLICIYEDPATRRMYLRSIPDRARESQPP